MRSNLWDTIKLVFIKKMQCKALAQVFLENSRLFGWKTKKKGNCTHTHRQTHTHTHAAVEVHRMSVLSALALVHSYKTRKCPRWQYEQMFLTLQLMASGRSSSTWQVLNHRHLWALLLQELATNSCLLHRKKKKKMLVNSHEPFLPLQMSHGR